MVREFSLLLRNRLGWNQLARIPLETKLLVSACVLLSIFLLFGFRYPPGLDLPQHAHLFGLLANFHDSKFGVAPFYELQPLTPYLATYAVAVPLAKIFGALTASKLVLLGIALGTPYTLYRWLLAVGGEKSFAYFGFVLAFGYPFVWGFTSYGASLPVAFLCFEAWTLAPNGAFWRRTLTLAALVVLLFFSHAITFVLVATTLGLLTLCQPRTAFVRRASALFVAFLVSVGWYLGRGARHNQPTAGDPGFDRFALLFGAEFYIFDAYWASLAGLIMLAVVVVVARPVLAKGIGRWMPFGLALVSLFSLPNLMMATIFVGQRFAFLVHAFAPAAFSVTTEGPARRWVARASAALTVAFLVLTGVRINGLNRELQGLAKLTEKVPFGADLSGQLGASADDSEWFGGDQLINSFAWVTAEKLGLVYNDHAHFFQLPIVRSSEIPFPRAYRYFITRGPGEKHMVRQHGFRGKPIAEADAWALYENPNAPPLDVGFGTVVRYAQDWGELRRDRAVSGKEMKVADQHFQTGLGTHANSLIQIHPKSSGHLVGGCGRDDGGEGRDEVTCAILDHRGRVLHRAIVGAALERFEVPVRAGESIFLKATMTNQPGAGRNVNGVHFDWVALEVRDKH